MKNQARRFLTELLSLPTAPYQEQHVIAYVRRWADRLPGVRVETDAFGNLRVHLRRGRPVQRPLVFSAHMDHPGFEAGAMLASGRLQAAWRGGVLPEYFPGTGVRFHTGGGWVRGRIESMKVAKDARGRRRVQTVTVAVKRPVEPGSIGMWDLPDPTTRGTRLFARGCDDVAGVAAVVAAMDRLASARTPIDLYALFTRAEEVGFAGAIAAARHGFIPRGARIVAVEISSEIPGVKMGDGPILRVGDRDAVFTPGLTAFCRQVAEDLGQADRTFHYQRKLMDAGTCESAAFCEYGHEATGLCVALGNYHNMDRRRQRIGPEYIDLGDFDGLVKWFIALATSPREYRPGGSPAFRKVLDLLERETAPILRRTARRVGRTVTA